MTIYRYGSLAWFWRVLLAAGLAFGALCLVAGAWFLSPVFFAIGAPVLVPALFLGLAVTVRVDRFGDGTLVVTSLVYATRRLRREDLGAPRVRKHAEGEFGSFHAPRAWIPVQRSWPIYLDLLGDIPDRSAFASVFRIDKRDMPAARRM